MRRAGGWHAFGVRTQHVPPLVHYGRAAGAQRKQAGRQAGRQAEAADAQLLLELMMTKIAGSLRRMRALSPPKEAAGGGQEERRASYIMAPVARRRQGAAASKAHLEHATSRPRATDADGRRARARALRAPTSCRQLHTHFD